ncbi:uncharacterized protein C1orf131 homolog isoform X2 [Anoplophora glabripennis]|nr:uncharacterized protein C1orf131 homolog isoform X2 [Anoplophora glabripennis]XP_018565286.1 uncharacterized protein C1orf131 homolog isoform X2 [Anoplophora glabripennis]
MEEQLDTFIPTRGSMMQKKGKIDFQEVTYESYKSTKRKKKLNGSEEITKNKEHGDFNIKKAKHEIIKFGMSGFDPQKKEEAEIQLAIKLGAKPPKNKYKNYKLLQVEKKKEKEKETSRQNFLQLGKNNAGKSTAKGKSFDRKRKKGKGDILSIYGKVKT